MLFACFFQDRCTKEDDKKIAAQRCVITESQHEAKMLKSHLVAMDSIASFGSQVNKSMSNRVQRDVRLP